MPETVNLDCMDDEELRAFRAAMDYGDSGYPHNVAQHLGDYATLILVAREARLSGDVTHAMNLEREADSIYCSLPEKVQW